MGFRSGTAGGSAVFLTIISAVSQVLSFGYRVGLSRLAGAEVMGLYQLVMPVYSVLMSITAVGLTAAVSNLSARYLALGNSRAANQTVRQCLGLFFLMIIPTALVTVGLYDPISVDLLGDARTQLGLILLLPCVALTGVENFHKHFFYGTGQVYQPALVELLEQVIRAGAVLGLLCVFLPQNPERTVGLIVVGMILCEVFSSITLVILYRRRMRRIGMHGERERSRRLFRRIMSIVLPVGSTALLGNLMGAVNAALIPQRLVAGGMERGEAMAAFGVVCGMTIPMLNLPTIFLSALNLVMVPRITRNCALGQRKHACEQVEHTLRMVAVLILPCMGLLAVVGADLGMLLFGEQSAGQYIGVLAFAMACGCFQTVLASALNAAQRQGICAAIAILCDVVQLAFTALGMGRPGAGLNGFVAGVAVSSVLGLILCGWAVCRFMGLNPGAWKLTGIPGLAALLSGQTSLLLRRCLEGAGAGEVLRVVGVLVFGVGIYLCALMAMGMQPGRRNMFFHTTGKNCVDK